MMIFIGITDSETAYDNYPEWIKGEDANIEIIRLHPGNQDEMERCAGIVLSGGIDVHPQWYKNPRVEYPNGPAVHNPERDAFELAVFEQALVSQLPVLAICRGMQLLNVSLGGTLIQDLEENQKSNHRKQGGKDGLHEIAIEKGSLLHDLSQSASNTVNSAHHQGLDHIAGALRVTAWSPDGVAEAVEMKQTYEKPFFLGVQWHPERFLHYQPNHFFTKNIRQQFLAAAKK